MAKLTAEGKIYATFTINETTKKRFNIACSALEISMSPTVEALIENFLEISKVHVEEALYKSANVSKAQATTEFVNELIDKQDGE
jgi:hypothetical protein